MSADEPASRRVRLLATFSDIYYFVRFVASCFGFGITVVMCAEVYLAVSSAPRPVWLDPLESFYGIAWKVTKHVVGAAFSATGISTPAVDPACAVSLVQFRADGTEAARFAVHVNKLVVLPELVNSSTGVSWQKVRTGDDPAHAYQGWVNKADLDEKLARPDCH